MEATATKRPCGRSVCGYFIAPPANTDHRRMDGSGAKDANITSGSHL